MRMTYSYTGLLAPKADIARLKAEMRDMPQYEPVTTHHFHGGMYGREVYRDAGVLVVGRVHKKAHFYQLLSGSVLITQEGEQPMRVDAPALLKSNPGTERAVFALTPATCITWHATSATTPEEAEAELLEPDDSGAYDADNKVKPGFLKMERKEVIQ